MSDSSGIVIGIITIVAGGIGFAIQQHMVTSPGRDLANKFAGLGTLTGRTRAEITAVVGAPSAVSSVGNGQSLLQWQATGYHIALLFTGDACDGVSHESSSLNSD